MRPQRLTLDSEALETFRERMDAALNMMIFQMKDKQLTEGTVTGKINVILLPMTDEDTGERYYKMEIEPQIDVNVKAKAKIECPVTAGIFAAFDEQGAVMVASNQISMDDLMEEGRE